MIQRYKKSEDAVSPVIGVMLMLVVTVVIAAVITGFATGFAGDTDKTPMALFEAEEYVGKIDSQLAEINPQFYGTNSFGFVHKGGDEIPLENIRITLEQIGGGGTGTDGFIRVFEATRDKTQGDCSPEAITNSGMFILTYPLIVLGKGTDDDPLTGVTVSTGDTIRVSPVIIDPYSGPDWDSLIPSGVTFKWTISDIRTNGVIAKGEITT